MRGFLSALGRETEGTRLALAPGSGPAGRGNCCAAHAAGSAISLPRRVLRRRRLGLPLRACGGVGVCARDPVDPDCAGRIRPPVDPAPRAAEALRVAAYPSRPPVRRAPGTRGATSADLRRPRRDHARVRIGRRLHRNPQRLARTGPPFPCDPSPGPAPGRAPAPRPGRRSPRPCRRVSPAPAASGSGCRARCPRRAGSRRGSCAGAGGRAARRRSAPRSAGST